MNTQLYARDRGILLPVPPWSGEVLSLYKRAINVRHPENLLISLIKDTTHMTALSICVPSLFEETKTAHISEGMMIRSEKGRVLLDRIEIETLRASVWDGSLKLKHVRGFHSSKLSMLQKALLREGKRDGLLPVIDPEKTYSPFVAKCAKVLDRIASSKKYPKGFSNIIGFGIGFTPSGDDFIAGALLGEMVLNLLHNPSKNHVEPVSIDKREVLQALDKTNIAGRTLLWQALKGQFPFYLLRAVHGIAGADGFKEVVDVVREAVYHGETSGTDALTGLFWYLYYLT